MSPAPVGATKSVIDSVEAPAPSSNLSGVVNASATAVIRWSSAANASNAAYPAAGAKVSGPSDVTGYASFAAVVNAIEATDASSEALVLAKLPSLGFGMRPTPFDAPKVAPLADRQTFRKPGFQTPPEAPLGLHTQPLKSATAPNASDLKPPRLTTVLSIKLPTPLTPSLPALSLILVFQWISIEKAVLLSLLMKPVLVFVMVLKALLWRLQV